MRLSKLKQLTDNMKENNLDKEHYTFVYNNFFFDVILSIVSNGYEILVAIHTENWGCVLNMDHFFNVEMSDNDYYTLRDILHLNWNDNHFGSRTFLQLLSDHAPTQSNLNGVTPVEMRRYLPYRQVEESLKIYFCGWNDHIIKEPPTTLIKLNFILERLWLIIVVKIILVPYGQINLVMKEINLFRGNIVKKGHRCKSPYIQCPCIYYSLCN